MHVNTKKLTDDSRQNTGISLLLQCDADLNRVQHLCEKQCREEFLPVKGFGTAHSNGDRSEKSAAETVKINDSKRHSVA